MRFPWLTIGKNYADERENICSSFGIIKRMDAQGRAGIQKRLRGKNRAGVSVVSLHPCVKRFTR